MDSHNKWLAYFLVGGFIVAILMISLYRAIKTTSDIFGFLFVSSIIIIFFTTFLLESMIVDSIMENIIEAAEGSTLIYNIIFFSLFISITFLAPAAIIHSINEALNDNPNPQASNCFSVLDQVFTSPESIYDKILLSKCRYTQPLTKLFTAQNSSQNTIQFFFDIADDYLDLISNNLTFIITLLLAIFGGASYLVAVGLAIKKGGALIIGFLSATAIKMILDGEQIPEIKLFNSGKSRNKHQPSKSTKRKTKAGNSKK